MSLKDELKIWAAALNAFNAGNYRRALELFGVRILHVVMLLAKSASI